MVLALHIISTVLTVVLVTANLSKNLTSSQYKLESTNTFHSNILRDDGEGFALYEMVLSFPHLMTLSCEYILLLHVILRRFGQCFET